jgi:hypothetical protein
MIVLANLATDDCIAHWVRRQLFAGRLKGGDHPLKVLAPKPTVIKPLYFKAIR